MNAFKQCRRIEAESFEILKPFIEARADEGRYVVTEKGRLALQLQREVGDVLLNLNGEVLGLELKAEMNASPNLFLETWSNLNPDASRFKAGWLPTLNTDFLFYHFLETQELHILDYPALKKWSFGYVTPSGKMSQGHIYEYKERAQGKYQQLNNTVGRCVPIDVLRKAVPFKSFQLGASGFEPLEFTETGQAVMF